MASLQVVLIQGYPTHHFPGQFFFFFLLKNVLVSTTFYQIKSLFNIELFTVWVCVQGSCCGRWRPINAPTRWPLRCTTSWWGRGERPLKVCWSASGKIAANCSRNCSRKVKYSLAQICSNWGIPSFLARWRKAFVKSLNCKHLYIN